MKAAGSVVHIRQSVKHKGDMNVARKIPEKTLRRHIKDYEERARGGRLERVARTSSRTLRTRETTVVKQPQRPTNGLHLFVHVWT